ncbi:hypothetical protein XELAEV_18003436mg [Xenopus laevis]|nr:hypothetical protein XELAEV_18003436mg [Xenopus laevis]
MTYLSSEGICIEFRVMIQYPYIETSFMTLQNISTNVIIFCGTVSRNDEQELDWLRDVLQEKTLIFTTNWLYYKTLLRVVPELYHGGLALNPNLVHYQNESQIRQFADRFHPHYYPEDNLLDSIWMDYFSCPLWDMVLKRQIYSCSTRRLSDLPEYNDGFGIFSMELAVDLMSHALNYIVVSLDKENSDKNRQIIDYKQQLAHYLKKVQFTDSSSHKNSFNEKGEFDTSYWIVNFSNNSYATLDINNVGLYVPWAPPGMELNISLDLIEWKTQDNKLCKS